MSRVLRNDLRLRFSASCLKPQRSRTRLSASIPTSSCSSPLSRLNAQTRRLSTTTSKYQQPHATNTDTATSSTSSANGQANPTPVPEGSLAIVFTDIVKSTHIWETQPSAMKEAMYLHDSMIRSVTTHHRGYEVKQNGDGFMIAFQSAIAALEFCLDVQKKLMEIKWPQRLLEMSAGNEVKRDAEEGEKVLWRGLRVRMSAHFGEPVCKWNEVIQRMDYLGPMVNRAARFIQATEGGQIVVSEEFLDELQKSKSNNLAKASSGNGPLFESVNYDKDDEGAKLDLKDLDCQDAQDMLTERQFEIRLLGRRHFKGIEEMQKLFFIIPYSLRGRVEYWPRHMQVPGSKGNLVG